MEIKVYVENDFVKMVLKALIGLKYFKEGNVEMDLGMFKFIDGVDEHTGDYTVIDSILSNVDNEYPPRFILSLSNFCVFYSIPIKNLALMNTFSNWLDRDVELTKRGMVETIEIILGMTITDMDEYTIFNWFYNNQHVYDKSIEPLPHLSRMGNTILQYIHKIKERTPLEETIDEVIVSGKKGDYDNLRKSLNVLKDM